MPTSRRRPRLEPRPPARIVLTTSDTHFGDFRHTFGTVPAPRWDEVRRLADATAFEQDDRVTAGRRAYPTSKLGVIYLAHALARRLPDGVEIFTFNPGLVPGTGLLRSARCLERFAFRWLLPALSLTPLARRPQVAGKQLAVAAVGPVAAPSGSYLNGTSAEQSSPQSYDTDREEELWASLEALAGAR